MIFFSCIGNIHCLLFEINLNQPPSQYRLAVPPYCVAFAEWRLLTYVLGLIQLRWDFRQIPKQQFPQKTLSNHVFKFPLSAYSDA